MLTVRELLRLTQNKLQELNKETHVAKLLFSHLVNKEPHELFLMMDEEVNPIILNEFEKKINEYYEGKPIQHIIGTERFFGRDFEVNSNVLIPRYETEELVEKVLQCIHRYFSEKETITLCDVGTGSGAIAISLKCEEPKLNVYATDISSDALEVAKRNAKRNNASIHFLEGDMVEPLMNEGIKVDLFVSNPPYIKEDTLLDDGVINYEPHLALFGGKDGMQFYRQILKTVSPILNDKAIIAFEIGYDQKEDISKEIEIYFKNCPYEVLKDINGKDRMVFIYKNVNR